MAAQVFGLDIGRSFIKAAQVRGKKLAAVGKIQTPGAGILSDSTFDLEQLSKAISSLTQSSNIQTKECVVSVIESQVVSRVIQMPKLTDKELSSAINWEAEQYIPLPLKDVNLQYEVVSDSGDKEGKMSVLLIAAPHRIIEKYVKVVKDAGLKAVAMETESVALVRALTRPADPAQIIASLGAASTELVITFGGNVVFTRSVAAGGLSLTKAIMSEFNLPQQQAEEYKHTYGILEDKLSGKVAAVLKPVLDVLASEILKAVEYSREHVAGASIARVIICGGGAFMPGLPEFLASRTNLDVSLADPFAGFEKDAVLTQVSGLGAFYSVSAGLAQRS